MAEIEFDCEEPATGADPATDAFIRESFEAVDTEVLTRLVEHAFKRMHLADDTYLSIAIVNEDEMERVHIEWMDLPGPTDVMSFPMDELRPGDGRTVMEGVLGDIVICPWVAAQQALAAGHSTMEEMMLLTIHGILHLLGYDHVTPEQERQMFGLQRQLLLTFFALRQGVGAQATLPAGASDALAEWDREHGSGRQIAK